MEPHANPDRQVDVVIVGASHAGVECAWTLRSVGYEGSILLLDADTAAPYQRPPLSKAMLAGATDAERLALRSDEAYRKHAIERMLGNPATALDAAQRVLETRDGSVIRYTHCVIATGARARTLPAPAGPDVYCIRTLADAEALRARIRTGFALLVVGGGYLGLEAASTAAKLGARVAVLEHSGALMSGRVSPHTAAAFESLHRAAGIEIVREARILGWDRDAEGWHARLADGRSLRGDAVLVCVGAIPNTELAERAGLRCEDGIVVDDVCRTSAAGIYAIGDCAASHRTELGRHGRIESVHNALEQARIAAAAIAGTPPPARRAPTFWSEQQGRRLQMAGLARPGAPCSDQVTETPKGWLVERFQGGVLAVVEAVDSPVEFMRAAKRIGTPRAA